MSLGSAGIDSGKDGFLAVLAADGITLLEFFPTPKLSDGSYNIPEMKRIVGTLRGRVGLVALEHPLPMPEEDPRSTFMQGIGIGLWMCALHGEVPFVTVEPREWKDEMGVTVPSAPRGSRPKPPTVFAGLGAKEIRRRVGTLRRRVKEGYSPTPEEQAGIDFAKATSDRSSARKKAAKGLSEGLAQRLYPGVDFRRTPKCTTLHDGKCEAALLAKVAWRRFLGRAS
jgi:hypothetical protein